MTKGKNSLSDFAQSNPNMFGGGANGSAVEDGEEVEVLEVDAEAVETLDAPLQSQELAAHNDFLLTCGDGFDLTPEQAKAHIQEAAGRMLEDYVRIGKRLFIIKEKLPRGQFLDYMNDEFPLSYRVGSECMLIAKRIMASKVADVRNFLQAVSGGSKQKALLVLGVSDEEIEAAKESDEFIGRPLEEVGELSYRQLKEELRKAKRDRDRVQGQRDKAESKLADAKEQLDAMRGVEPEEDPTALSHLELTYIRTLEQLGRFLDALKEAQAKADYEDEVIEDSLSKLTTLNTFFSQFGEILNPPANVGAVEEWEDKSAGDEG